MRMCVHCGEKAVNRPRGLCWACYYLPGVREQYASPSKYAQRGVELTGRVRPLPRPTRALPGTAHKIAVLRERVRLGLELWHPDDAQLVRPGNRRRMAG